MIGDFLQRYNIVNYYKCEDTSDSSGKGNNLTTSGNPQVNNLAGLENVYPWTGMMVSGRLGYLI